MWIEGKNDGLGRGRLGVGDDFANELLMAAMYTVVIANSHDTGAD